MESLKRAFQAECERIYAELGEMPIGTLTDPFAQARWLNRQSIMMADSAIIKGYCEVKGQPPPPLMIFNTFGVPED